MTYGQQGGRPPYGAPPPPYGAPPPPPYGQPSYGPPRYPAPPAPYAAPPKPRRRPERPTGGPVDEEDERWAVPAYVGMFVSGFVAPAVVLAVKGRTSNFARFHAIQALNLFVAMFACTFLALLLAYLKGLDWLPLVFVALAADSFFVVRAAIGANRCEWYRLPALVAWRIFR
jgi:uncharacterized membrane protein